MPKKNELIESLYSRGFLNDDEEIILSDGFEEAFIGSKAVGDKIAYYDFFKALAIVVEQTPELDFNQCYEWLEDFANSKVENAEYLTPVFIKTYKEE